VTPVEINQLIALFNAGRYMELEDRATSLVKQYPDSGFSWKVLSVSLQMQGKDSLYALQKTTELLPDDAEAHANLGNAFRDLGRLDEAVARYRQALVLKPDFAETQNNLGNALRDLGQLDDAIASFRLALGIKPDYAEAHYNLGNILLDLGQLDDALASYRRAVALKPDFAEAHNNLGIALQDLGQLDDALASFCRVLEINPDYADAHYNLGNIFNDKCRYDEAETHYRRALTLRPKHAETHNNLGNALRDQGRLDEACLSFETAISIKPDFIESHYSLSALKTYSDCDPHLDMLEQQLPHLAALPPETRIRYWFTLGKVREDLGRYDESFIAYHEGNRLQHAQLATDEAAEDAMLERMMSVFSAEFFAERPQPPHSGKSPIFIVGMPRSGTSLLEQILSTYPGVHGAGELSDMSKVVTAAMPEAAFKHFPDAVAGLFTEDFRRMGEQYTEQIWRHAPTALHITDKMPSNFFYLGMIHLMLPNAKIIHAMRDPMDSCFSCYSRLFLNNNLSYAYDLDALGRYYVRYIKLMRHWHSVLPSNTILDLRYEELVADTEGQARRLLEYLELPWDSRCLDYHQNKRLVKTASVAQVRKPIYHTSLARWKRYEHHLDPLFDLVKDYRG
jgi:tetratricopeptide (TPR) repeat protein